MWLKILHNLGLTNLSEDQVDEYENIREVHHMRLSHGVIFLAVGIALVAVSALINQTYYQMWSSIALNLGLVAIAVVLVEHLWRISGGRPLEHQVSSLSDQVTRLEQTVDIVDAGRRVGLDHVYDRLTNFGTQADWELLLQKAESRVDLMGRTLFGWTHSVDLEELIQKKIVTESVKFRWLIMSPKNSHLSWLAKEVINDGRLLETKLSEVHRRLRRLRENLPEEFRHNLQVREFCEVPLYCAVTRVDERCLVTPYLHTVPSDGSPLLSLRDSNLPWMRRYIDEFERIWEISDDVFKDNSEQDGMTISTDNK